MESEEHPTRRHAAWLQGRAVVSAFACLRDKPCFSPQGPAQPTTRIELYEGSWCRCCRAGGMRGRGGSGTAAWRACGADAQRLGTLSRAPARINKLQPCRGQHPCLRVVLAEAHQPAAAAIAEHIVNLQRRSADGEQGTASGTVGRGGGTEGARQMPQQGHKMTVQHRPDAAAWRAPLPARPPPGRPVCHRLRSSPGLPGAGRS